MSRSNFSASEDTLLLQLRKRHGQRKWAEIAIDFNGNVIHKRSVRSVQRRIERLLSSNVFTHSPDTNCFSVTDYAGVNINNFHTDHINNASPPASPKNGSRMGVEFKCVERGYDCSLTQAPSSCNNGSRYHFISRNFQIRSSLLDTGMTLSKIIAQVRTLSHQRSFAATSKELNYISEMLCLFNHSFCALADTLTLYALCRFKCAVDGNWYCRLLGDKDGEEFIHAHLNYSNPLFHSCPAFKKLMVFFSNIILLLHCPEDAFKHYSTLVVERPFGISTSFFYFPEPDASFTSYTFPRWSDFIISCNVSESRTESGDSKDSISDRSPEN